MEFEVQVDAMTSPGRFPIVGIGASAGGVEAMKGFFRGVPEAFGGAIVVVTHLSPERESLLPEVVRHLTALPVVAEADTQVEPDHVYIAPPGMLLGICAGRLSVTPVGRFIRTIKPVDVFFTALSLDQGERAVGVILSGGDGDGAIGVKAIKEQGGLTLAQSSDRDGPRMPDMPLTAMNVGAIDYSVTAEEMGALIAAYYPGRDDASSSASADPNAGAVAEEVLAEIYAILRQQVGHDFSGYKRSTFQRRLFRRIKVGGDDGPEAYLKRLRGDGAEAVALFRDLLIGVTKFFRDAAAFDALATLVVPKLFADRGSDDAVRVWVPACSTGEEVYSIAILLREYMDTLVAPPRVQIFATDIDERSLAVARIGRYPHDYLDAVSPDRIARHFVGDAQSLTVHKAVRDLCTFAPHSVLRDPPFSRIDLISCRNLLIYLTLDAQEQMLPVLHYALRPGGYLFIGLAENITPFEDLFTTVERKHRIFQALDTIRPARLPSMTGITSADLAPAAEARPRVVSSHASLRQIVEAEILSEFAPAHAVVTRAGVAVHFSARIGSHLEIATGQPTHELAAMAPKGLRLELRTALREAIEGNSPVVRRCLEVGRADGRAQVLSLTVKPLPVRPGSEPLFLVVFDELPPPADPEQRASQTRIGRDDEIPRLEAELESMRERLQSIVEEYEAAIEESKSSNEELYSVNEEMQSANEELEASKEEIQSINEELHTVNVDLESKIDFLDQTNSDQAALFESADLACVFLDLELRIRTFTEGAARIFGIQHSDRGRLLTTFAAPFPMAWLPQDARAVIAEQTVPDRTLAGSDNTRYRARLTASRRDGAKVSGIVVSFTRLGVEGA